MLPLAFGSLFLLLLPFYYLLESIILNYISFVYEYLLVYISHTALSRESLLYTFYAQPLAPLGFLQVLSAVNGTRKEIHPDGRTIVSFYNGDVKETLPDQQVCAFSLVPFNASRPL